MCMYSKCSTPGGHYNILMLFYCMCLYSKCSPQWNSIVNVAAPVSLVVLRPFICYDPKCNHIQLCEFAILYLRWDNLLYNTCLSQQANPYIIAGGKKKCTPFLTGGLLLHVPAYFWRREAVFLGFWTESQGGLWNYGQNSHSSNTHWLTDKYIYIYICWRIETQKPIYIYIYATIYIYIIIQ